jgi:hypothetical protein
MLHEVIEDLPGDQVVVKLGNEGNRMVLDVLLEVDQIAVYVVIDLDIAALLTLNRFH